MTSRAYTILLEKPEEKIYLCSCGLSKKMPLCDGSHRGSGFKPVEVSLQADGKCAIRGLIPEGQVIPTMNLTANEGCCRQRTPESSNSCKSGGCSGGGCGGGGCSGGGCGKGSCGKGNCHNKPSDIIPMSDMESPPHS